MTVWVWGEHEVLKMYPTGTEWKWLPNGDLEVGGDKYPRGTVSAVSKDSHPPCCWLNDTSHCPVCAGEVVGI